MVNPIGYFFESIIKKLPKYIIFFPKFLLSPIASYYSTNKVLKLPAEESWRNECRRFVPVDETNVDELYLPTTRVSTNRISQQHECQRNAPVNEMNVDKMSCRLSDY